jgi:uncharacterized protein
MSRPPCCRLVAGRPAASSFQPVGLPDGELEEVVMALDELEALRLADLEGLYQDQAAKRMGVSRPTFGRILESARRKAAEALVGGKVLRIEGGPVHLADQRPLRCGSCGHRWGDSPGKNCSGRCPACRGNEVRACECRAVANKGHGPCRKKGRGMGYKES